NNGTFTIPTQAMKNGNFSSLLALGPQYQIYNPFSRTRVGSQFQEDPFKCDSTGNPIMPQLDRTLPGYGTQMGGTPCNIIPTQLINPVSQKLLQYFPNPTTPGSASADGQNNFLQPGLKERASYYTSTTRIDHNISDRHRIFGRASWYDRNSTYNNYFNNIAT